MFIILTNVYDDRNSFENLVHYAIVPSDSAAVKDTEYLSSTAALTFTGEKDVCFSLSQDDMALSEGIYKIYFMIKDSIGNASDIQELAFYKLDSALYDGTLKLDGEYVQDDNKIVLNWEDSASIESVDCYVRTNNDIYKFYGTIKDALETEIILGTSPAVYTEDGDYDQDGLSNSREFEIGTNPYLSDSDFDGIKDSEDSNPLKSEVRKLSEVDFTTEIHVGKYDRVDYENNEQGTNDIYTVNVYQQLLKQVKSEKSVKSYYYDRDGNQVAVIEEADGQYRSNVYTYQNGNIIYASSNGLGYTFSYDTDDNITEISVADRKIVSCNYKNINNGEDSILTSLQNGSDDQYSYQHNEDGSVAQALINGEIAFAYQYDDNKQLIFEKDYMNDVEYTYSYDANGNTDKIVCNNGFSFVFSTSEDEEEGKTVHKKVYEDKGIERVFEVTVVKDDAVNVNSKTATMINGDIADFNVNGNTSTEISTIVNAKGNTVYTKTVQDLSAYSCEVRDGKGNMYLYQYDNQGQIISIQLNGQDYMSYIYDGMNQLIQENNAQADITVGYTYDRAGNITSKSTYTYTKEKATGEPLETKRYSYKDGSWTSLLTEYDGELISYDSFGNPKSYRNNMKMDWKYFGQLSHVKVADQDINYQYDKDGIRTKKTIGDITTKYTYEDGRILKQETDEQCIWFLYDGNDKLAGFELDGTTYYYEKDLLNDVVGILDEDGNELVSFGTKPSKLNDYFTAHKIGVLNFTKLSTFESAIKYGGVYIMSFRIGGQLGIHTVAFTCENRYGNKRFVVYNVYNNSKKTYYYNSVKEVLDGGQFLRGYVVSKKK